VFTFNDYGSTRLLSAWDFLSNSPMMTQFAWSPLVQSVILQTLPHLGEPKPSTHPPSSPIIPETFDGLLAIHLRRGDFDHHCKFLHQYTIPWNAWNCFPDYPDPFFADPSSISTEEKQKLYTEQCFPNLDEIVSRIQLVKTEWEAAHQQSGTTTTPTPRQLNRIYVMTNADATFAESLRQRLGGWKTVVTSRDLAVSPEASEVAVAADMLIGVNAEVFLGNGFSSLTANINLIRRTKGRDPSSTRFW